MLAKVSHYRNFPTSCNGYSKYHEVLWSITAFDLVTFVQTLQIQRLRTTTNSTTLYAFCFLLLQGVVNLLYTVFI